MDITLIIKIAGIGLLISVINMVLETAGRKDWATWTALSGVVIVLGIILVEIVDLFNTVKTMFQLY